MADTMNLHLTEAWDKTFPKSDKVQHSKVTFHNRYGITLAADLYRPKDAAGKLAAIAVCGPFGAVKEQCSGLYAQTMAERGFLTLAFDPSFTGESGGTPRYMASPDINTEDFQAAVDYLSLREDVDADRVGILGICGWGGLALNAAALDTRVKATVAVTMYDMARVNANGYFDAEDSEEARYRKKTALNAQRLKDYQTGTYALGGGVVDPLPEGRPRLCERLLRLLQDPAGLPSPVPQLQRTQRSTVPVLYEPADPSLQQRDPLRRADPARRRRPLLLFRQGRLRRHDGGEPLPRKQRAAGGARRHPHRPI